MDNIFDDLHLDITDESTDVEPNETNDNDDVSANHLFDDLHLDDETNEDESKNVNEVDEDNAHDVKDNSEVSDVKEANKVDNVKPLTINDVDEFFKRNKELEEQKAELAKYKAEEEARRKEAEAKKAEDNKMPDPLYNPEEYRKWVYDQNKAIEARYESRLAEIQNKMVIDNITSNLNRSYNSCVEKFGEDNVKEAEAWAASIIKSSPKEAMAYLQANPSWDYIVTEYNKAKERDEYQRDPEEYINKKIKERESSRNESNEVKQDVKTDVNVTPTKEKKVVKSINSIPSKGDPKPEVPHFFEGLF